MKIVAYVFIFFLISCSSYTLAGGDSIIKTKSEFRNAEGKEIDIEGKFFRSKEGSFLICEGFSVLLNGYDIPKDDIEKPIKLKGIARVLRAKESKEEWENRVKNEPPFTHSEYHAEQLVLEAIK